MKVRTVLLRVSLLVMLSIAAAAIGRCMRLGRVVRLRCIESSIIQILTNLKVIVVAVDWLLVRVVVVLTVVVIWCIRGGGRVRQATRVVR